MSINSLGIKSRIYTPVNPRNGAGNGLKPQLRMGLNVPNAPQLTTKTPVKK